MPAPGATLRSLGFLTGLGVASSVVSFTAATNLHSQRVMQRIGLRFDRAFDHPRLPVGHRLHRPVLYRSPPSS